MSLTSPFETGRILHQRYEACRAMIAEQIDAAEGGNGAIIPLLGPTRSGKSELLADLHAAFGTPVRATGLLRDGSSFAVGRIPPKPNDREIHAAVLQALGLRAAQNEKTALVRERALEAINHSGVRILALDECSHLSERGSNLSARAAADHLKALVDETKITLLLSGLPQFKTIIHANEQFRDRSGATAWLLPYDWQREEDYHAFAGSVLTGFDHLRLAGLHINLDEGDIIRRLYGATAGRIGMLVRILALAAHRSNDTLDFAAIAGAVRCLQRQPVPAETFFCKNEPDDAQLIRSYALIMQEAELDVRPTTLAGFAAANAPRITA